MSLLERMTQENKIKEVWLEGVIFSIPDDDFAVMVAGMEWPKRIRTILQVHQKRIQDEYDHYEATFKKKRNEFVVQLDRLALNILNKYVEDVILSPSLNVQKV